MRRAVLLVLLILAARARGAVRINEIAFDQSAGPDWVELYNPDTSAVLLDGWVLSDMDAASGNEIHLVFPTPLPSGAFLIVFVDAAGPSDFDFSDGAGAVYSGTATTVNLAATEDELALFNGPGLASAALVDFVAWVTDGDYNGVADQTQALTAGIWTASAAVTLSDLGNDYSIGRRRDGADADRPEDFEIFQRPTPGQSNVPPPPPDSHPLQIDPATRSFSPFDPEVGHRAVRLFYNAGSPAVVKTIRIFDSRGRAVRDLLVEDVGPAGRNLAGSAAGILEWDGKDNAGEILPVGIYVVFYEGADPSAGGLQRGRGVVALGRPR